MDFFKKQAQSFLSEETEKPKPEGGHGSGIDEPKKSGSDGPKKSSSEVPSYSELMGSANVLLGAARQQVGGGGAKKEGGQAMDTAKLADAAEDVLQAASHYGKLEGTAYGNYVKKAEDYLHTYQSREADVTPEKKEAAAGELKAAAKELKGKSSVQDKTVEAVEEKIEGVGAPVDKKSEEAAP